MGAMLADVVANNGTVIGLLITTVFGFLGSITTMIYQSISAERSRRWLHEDQKHDMELARLKSEEQARILAEQTVQAANDVARKQVEIANQLAQKNSVLAQQIEERAVILETKLEANTVLTKKAVEASSAAHQVANNVNEKIVTNQKNIQALQEQLTEAAEILNKDTKSQLDRMEQTGDNTNEAVREIVPQKNS